MCSGEPSRGADVAGASPVSVEMWCHGPAQSRCRFPIEQCPATHVTKLLVDHCVGTESLRDVTEQDCEILGEYFSIVKFSENDAILTNRKIATCALLHVSGMIIISEGGRVLDRVLDKQVVWCGEFALLTAGQRQYDVIAGRTPHIVT